MEPAKQRPVQTGTVFGYGAVGLETTEFYKGNNQQDGIIRPSKYMSRIEYLADKDKNIIIRNTCTLKDR